MFDLIIKNCRLFDGTGNALKPAMDVGIIGEDIEAVGNLESEIAYERYNAEGKVLSPGFIDVHTHDDLALISDPDMTFKISQGVTSVIVGNCGISAACAKIKSGSELLDPMHLLGAMDDFKYDSVQTYRKKLEETPPSVNVAVLIGHTTLRNNFLSDLSLPAVAKESIQMQNCLNQAMNQGAIGLSSGLAYKNAKAAPKVEVESLLAVVSKYDGVYTTHLRTEFDGIVEAMREAFDSSGKHGTRLIISHHKVAGKNNWGRSKETLSYLEKASTRGEVSCDCYPYHASSSTLDLAQVTDDFDIQITWSTPHPDMAGLTLKDIAYQWKVSLEDAAKKLQPAGAIYYNMDPNDVENILSWRKTMIGSDGLPCDPNPHPRLYGTFPRVLGPLVRDSRLFDLPTALLKMTGLPATQFPLGKRGYVSKGFKADLVLFDPDTISDVATFENPKQLAQGIEAVWVNGQLSYQPDDGVIIKKGKFIERSWR